MDYSYFVVLWFACQILKVKKDKFGGKNLQIAFKIEMQRVTNFTGYERNKIWYTFLLLFSSFIPKQLNIENLKY